MTLPPSNSPSCSAAKETLTHDELGHIGEEFFRRIFEKLNLKKFIDHTDDEPLPDFEVPFFALIETHNLARHYRVRPSWNKKRNIKRFENAEQSSPLSSSIMHLVLGSMNLNTAEKEELEKLKIRHIDTGRQLRTLQGHAYRKAEKTVLQQLKLIIPLPNNSMRSLNVKLGDSPELDPLDHCNLEVSDEDRHPVPTAHYVIASSVIQITSGREERPQTVSLAGSPGPPRMNHYPSYAKASGHTINESTFHSSRANSLSERMNGVILRRSGLRTILQIASNLMRVPINRINPKTNRTNRLSVDE